MDLGEILSFRRWAIGQKIGASQATKAENLEFGFGELYGEPIGELVPRFTNPPKADRAHSSLSTSKSGRSWSSRWRSIIPSIDLS